MILTGLNGFWKRHGRLVLAAVAMLFALGAATAVEAGHRRGHGSIRFSRQFRDSGRIRGSIRFERDDALQLQREAIAAREEEQREKGRQVRREELRKIRETSEKEYLEAQEAIRATSRAASRAPRGFYFRPPGHETTRLPAGHDVLTIGDLEYYTFKGIFFRKVPKGYIVVTAPPGAVVKSLPEGATPIRRGKKVYHYYFGTFFTEVEGGYATIVPPDGTAVMYLPDGYQTVRGDEGLTYTYGSIRFRPFYQDGILVYAVTKS